MQIKKLLVAAVIPFALLGCPDKAADTKPDPAAAASAAKHPATTTTAAVSAAAPAKSGGW